MYFISNSQNIAQQNQLLHKTTVFLSEPTAHGRLRFTTDYSFGLKDNRDIPAVRSLDVAYCNANALKTPMQYIANPCLRLTGYI